MAEHLIVAFHGFPDATWTQFDILEIGHMNNDDHLDARNTDIHVNVFPVAGGSNHQDPAIKGIRRGTAYRKHIIVIDNSRYLTWTTLHGVFHHLVVVVGVVETFADVESERLRILSEVNGFQRVDHHWWLILDKALHREGRLHRLSVACGEQFYDSATCRVLLTLYLQGATLQGYSHQGRIAIGSHRDDNILIRVVGVIESVGQINRFRGRISLEDNVVDGIGHHRRQVGTCDVFVGTGTRRIGTGFSIDVGGYIG